jgi:hypothetical protein
MRGEIAEAAVGRKALIKTIADFIKAVLPDTTLAPKTDTPESESVELGTQTVQDSPTTPQPLPSTSSAEKVSPRFTYDDNDDEVHKFARKSFGEIAIPTYHHMFIKVTF